MWQRKPEREQKEETKQSRWGFRGKTFWDWLPIVGALLVPVAVALGTGWITWQLAENENQRAEAERELAEQRAQDEALQAYLDQMGQLMLDRKLLEAEPGDPVHTLAQARTSTVILRLDAEHNESVTRFLMNSGLAVSHKALKTSGLAVSRKASAKLLSEITLSKAKLSGAYLLTADLSEAYLYEANLSVAILALANLSKAYLSKADLSGANLIDADLSGANLKDANLKDANLKDADLSGADLRFAGLSGAKGITNEELAQQAKYLRGTTMPDGQQHEDWLKDKKAQGKDENNE